MFIVSLIESAFNSKFRSGEGEGFVSARLMYLILGHLSVRDSTCSSLTRSLARFMAISVGVTSWHIWMIASCFLLFVPVVEGAASLLIG